MRRYGSAAAVLVALILAGSAAAYGQEIPDKSYKSWSPMPILMFDNDIGVGYGGKIKFVDFLAKIVEQARDGKPRPRYRLEDERGGSLLRDHNQDPVQGSWTSPHPCLVCG